MRKLISLSMAMLKNTFSFVDQGKRKKTNQWIQWAFGIFLLISLGPSLLGLHWLTVEGVRLLQTMNQEGVIIALLFSAIALLIFFFGIFLVPAVYYFSKDIETLLALPLKAYEILSSKLLVTLVYEYLFASFIFIPVITGYIRVMNPSWLFYVMSFVIFLTLPLVPLIFASIIIMLIMWLVPFAKNRDLFNMISGFIALGVAIWFNFAFGGIAQISEGQLLEFLISGNNSLLAIFRYFIPNLPFAIQAVVSVSVLDFIIYLAITIAIYCGFLGLGQIVYFRGIIGINETSARRKNLTLTHFSKETRSSKAIISYLLKELRLLFRTPIYMLNCVSINILLPILLIAPLLFVPSGAEEIRLMIESIPWSDPFIYSLVAAFGTAVGLVMGSVNMISSTAISREGQHVYFMKMIPMSYTDQIHAKTWSGILLSWTGIVITILVAAIFLQAPWFIAMLFIMFSLVGSVFINYVSIIVDVLRPKLIWETEQAAVKQNMNFIFTMLPAMGLSYLIGWSVFRFQFDFRIYAPTTFMILVAGTWAVVFLAEWISEKRFPEM